MLLLAAAAGTAASLLERLSALADPWKDLYGDSKVLETLVVFLHVAPLVVGGGLALASDRATLRAGRHDWPERRRHLLELAGAHRVVLGSLALMFVSGIALFLSDVETFATSWVFWVKMGLVALLLANGLVMTRTERALAAVGDASASPEPEWRRLRTVAVASGVLWLATTHAGVALTNVWAA